MKPIIAPTNFSPASKNAVNYAADLAASLDRDLTVVHVCPLPLAYNEIPPTINMGQMVEDAEKEMKLLQDDLLLRVGDKIKINTKVLLGSVVPELKRICNEAQPFAIVMGTEQKGAFERLLTGGYAIDTVRQFSQPVFVIPPQATFKGFKRIGLACDYKDSEESIHLDDIKAIVKASRAELHVLYVGEDNSWEDFDNEMVEDVGWLSMHLEELKPAYDFVTAGKIEDGLNQYAEEKELDLLIMVPKKHGILSRMFLQSVSKQVVLHTHVPVMSIHE